MKNFKLSILALFFSINAFCQLTYVPDDAFELYIETYISGANNGNVNDNYVNSIGIQNATILSLHSALVPSGIINDFTGIQDFVLLNTMAIQYMNMTNIDLSLLNVISSSGLSLQLSLQSNNLVENLILPQGGSIKLNVTNCLSLSNIVFHSNNIIAGGNIGSCPSLTNFDVSMVSFVKLSSQIWLNNNSSLQCVNLKNGYCSNWSSVGITGNPLVTCVEVDNPSYCNIASGTTWNWEGPALDPSNIYSTNCGCVAGIDEKIIDEISISPNPTSSEVKITLTQNQLGKTFKLYDNIGREKMTGVFNSTQYTLHLESFEAGIYLLKIAEEETQIKIIKN
jgi:hypothetical protein